MRKQVRAWQAFEEDMAKYKGDLVLDKPFFHLYPNGEREQIKKVGEAISRVANTISKPEQQENEEAKLQQFADQLIQRIMALNVEFAHNPDVLRFAIFKLIYSFVNVRFVQACKKTDLGQRHDALNYLVNIFDRLHF